MLFSLNDLSKLKTFKARKFYVDQFLVPTNSGSSRAIYQLDSNRILKLAKNKKGLAQNITEKEIFLLTRDTEFKEDFTVVFDSHVDGFWLVVEQTEIIQDKDKFFYLTGVSIDDLENYLDRWWFDGILVAKVAFPHIFELPFAQKIIRLAIKTNLATGDLSRLDSWGIREDGNKLVLLDYGLTNKIYEKFYV